MNRFLFVPHNGQLL